ncbi:MAG: beta-ketoacyl-ACP synthase II [Oscillospiraceae bacterium]|jgi:3-oxoacyl-[acyl-carrier-protein] synthase II|nr:beta-ketoacyl-ACP synthase II [Oscillospiraceae bacterium]
MDRVVVTGIGVVSPVGLGAKVFWDNLLAGVCGIVPITRFDTTGYKAKLAGEVNDFRAEEFMDKREARRMDRYCQFAVAAARMAVTDAAADFAADADTVGAYIGSGIGGILTLEAEHQKLLERGPGRVSPFFIPMMISNMASGVVSMIFGIRGASLCQVSACASGAHAVGEAFLAIRRGDLTACLAGGAEAAITPLALAGFSNMTALSSAGDPALGLLPFDKRRAGFIMGEGAGVLMIESLERARARGARIYCEIVGYGATSDAYHITSPDPEGAGAARAMTLAMTQAGLAPQEIAYINAHGTGTPLNDAVETTAVHRAMGEAAAQVAMSSTKSMTGHLLGAAGGVEAAASVLTVYEDVMPPTIHYEEPDPACDLDCVPNTARRAPVRAAFSNSFGFGGHNASLLFQKYEA